MTCNFAESKTVHAILFCGNATVNSIITSSSIYYIKVLLYKTKICVTNMHH